MKPIVVYSSGTGFTQRYAEAIANKLECEVISIKEIKNKPLHTYDLVVYGGSLMANMLRSYSKIAKMNLSNIVVFAVGFSEPSEDNMSKIVERYYILEEVETAINRIELFKEDEQKVIKLKMQGYSNDEISRMTELSNRKVIYILTKFKKV